jgi:hypothetical protein
MKLYNVEINHPMITLHYIAEQVPLEVAIEVAKKCMKTLCPHSIFIEYVYEKDGTEVHESTSIYDILKHEN